MSLRDEFKRVSSTCWELPAAARPDMRVSARIHATAELFRELDDAVFQQLCNVATLPGVIEPVACMPDGHSGYGFPIGGVAATSVPDGVISPGGIGFDINCGMRLVRTNLTSAEVLPRVRELVDQLFKAVPCGVGRSGAFKPGDDDFHDLLEQGAGWCVRHGYGWEEDLETTEDRGCMEAADARRVSRRAIDRGRAQVGTLGSGNHYLEIQVMAPENVAAPDLAAAFGLTLPNQVVVMFHCGSRGFGHQVASDYLQRFLGVMSSKYRIRIRDRELACVPFESPEGRAYYAAMACAANMAFANRQIILHRIRDVFADVFGRSPQELDMHQIYDVSHNTAKIERHEVRGDSRLLLVHRKGATRAFPPGHPELPGRFQQTGQPVIVGGSMESGSYLLCGSRGAAETFYTTAHGSGRRMSRRQARRRFDGRRLLRQMADRGIHVRTSSFAGLAEEAGAAYKDIDEVVRAVVDGGLSRPVARFVPIANIKG
ncbi:MAG: RtcB family protein [Kiritimatiellaeota bacterium]|nr:RtcB family protein [Kiritimatiellota bacterium]